VERAGVPGASRSAWSFLRKELLISVGLSEKSFLPAALIPYFPLIVVLDGRPLIMVLDGCSRRPVPQRSLRALPVLFSRFALSGSEILFRAGRMASR
jgi:hypothetical protein